MHLFTEQNRRVPSRRAPHRIIVGWCTPVLLDLNYHSIRYLGRIDSNAGPAPPTDAQSSPRWPSVSNDCLKSMARLVPFQPAKENNVHILRTDWTAAGQKERPCLNSIEHADSRNI